MQADDGGEGWTMGRRRRRARTWVAGRRPSASGDPDRGDVPGWVMIAVMTAALVVAILVPFRNTIIPAMTSAIQDMFGQAR
jgi:hypothetical protein